MVKSDTVFANVHIGTGLNCEKDSIPTVKIGVFRMYLGSIKDAENLTSVPETKFDLPSSNNTDKDSAADEITETAFNNCNILGFFEILHMCYV